MSPQAGEGDAPVAVSQGTARPQIEHNLQFVYEAFPVLVERRRQLAGSMSGGQQPIQ